jgi:signal transduction histidine kinase
MDDSTRAIVGIARDLLDDLDLEAVLERVLASARDATGARYAAIGVLDPTRTKLMRFLTVGMDEATRDAIGPLPTGRGVLGELMFNPAALRLSDVSAHPHSYGFPSGHPPMHSFLGVPILIAGEPYGNLYLTEKRGADEFSAEDEEVAVILADLAGIAIDHARRFTGVEAERQTLLHTVAVRNATIAIARTLGGETDLGVILQLVATRGRALVSARALLLEVERDGELVVAASAGEVPDDLVGRTLPLDGTVAQVVLRDREARHFSGREADEGDSGLGRLGVPAGDGVAVPMVFRHQTFGVILALDRIDGMRFTPADIELLEAFAVSAATAVATARTAASDRRRQGLLSMEAERTRWARELHDDTLQAMASLRLGLSGARRSGDAASMAAVIDAAVEQLTTDVASLRSLITDLRPAALDELGIEAALRALGERLARTGIEVDFELDLAREAGRTAQRLTPELESAVYRIVQAALTNATQHGAAEHATVTVIEDANRVHVTIRDDGEGFDPAADVSGFGIVGMRERAALLDGTLTIESAPGGPTTVTASFPALQRDSPLRELLP